MIHHVQNDHGNSFQLIFHILIWGLYFHKAIQVLPNVCFIKDQPWFSSECGLNLTSLHASTFWPRRIQRFTHACLYHITFNTRRQISWSCFKSWEVVLGRPVPTTFHAAHVVFSQNGHWLRLTLPVTRFSVRRKTTQWEFPLASKGHDRPSGNQICLSGVSNDLLCKYRAYWAKLP